ncbi:MAG: hypothetical protein GY909_06705 [Oligoflexia bacterium]|nr:hypothetical protein [Oligoflexia bacterium]
MKKLLILVVASIVTISSTLAIDIQVDSPKAQSFELYDTTGDIEIIAFNPYWECGPCKLHGVIHDMAINEDEALNARTAIGKLFNKEVYFTGREISDIQAISMGLTGYPTTVILNEGKYLGHFTGAVTLRQMAGVISKLLDKRKYIRRANRYLKN